MTPLVDVSQTDKSRAANCPKEAWMLCMCGGSGVSGYSGFPCSDCGGAGGLPPDWLEIMLAEHRLTAEQAKDAEIERLTALLREARAWLGLFESKGWPLTNGHVLTSHQTGQRDIVAADIKCIRAVLARIDTILNKSAQTTASENPHHD